MQRQPFRVAAMEKGRREQFGGLSLGIRPDRVDELPDGSVALVDYKTGNVDPKQWDGERPAQPQLLAYLAAEQRPVSVLAFASLKAGKTGWNAKGRHLAANFLASGRSAGENPDWETFVQDSQKTVERLAAEFRMGMAAVDPAADRNPCQYCEQKPLCRIAEWRRDGNEPGEAEEGDQA
jgi:RecB family exonuclease